MLRIGITGGIGSGKSIVARIVESLNFPVFYSDKVAKELIATDAEIKNGLIQLFGQNLFSNGTLNRAKLAEHIFTDEAAKLKVNALIHPKVRTAFEEFVQQQQNSIVFNEAAIIFETESAHLYDKVILVTAPKEVRIERVQERDKISRNKVLERMENQWTDEKKIPLADFQIINDNQQSLIEQVNAILQDLSK